MASKLLQGPNPFLLPLTSAVLAKLTSSSPFLEDTSFKFQRPPPSSSTPSTEPRKGPHLSLLHDPSPPTFSQAPRQTPTAFFRDAAKMPPTPNVPAPASQRPPRPSQAPAQILLPSSHPTGPQTSSLLSAPGDPPPASSDQVRSAPSAPHRGPVPQPRWRALPRPPRRADLCVVTAPARARPQEVDPTAHWSAHTPLMNSRPPPPFRPPNTGVRPPHQNEASRLVQARFPQLIGYKERRSNLRKSASQLPVPEPPRPFSSDRGPEAGKYDAEVGQPYSCLPWA